ncbi:hypothetical protein ABIB73_007149 [Bradyrhizobium sp. F1.4.3]
MTSQRWPQGENCGNDLICPMDSLAQSGFNAFGGAKGCCPLRSIASGALLALGDLTAALRGPSPRGRTNTRIKGWMGRADQTTEVKGMFARPEQIAEIGQRPVRATHLPTSECKITMTQEPSA